MNARFWTYTNGGLVKITLRPGQTLNWSTHGPTEEGFSYEDVTWTHHGECVEMESSSGGRDCDGRIDHSHTSFCDIYALRLGNEPYALEDSEGVRYPAWECTHESQRDQYAEMMGY